jgi:CubicO group peptidase (beta-lactamase class C family)
MGAHHLVPFNEGKISFAPDRTFDPNSYPSGGGGMSGTAGDFLRLLEALRTGGGALLTARSIDLLSTIKPGDFETLLPGWKWPLGWTVLDEPAKTGTPQSRGTWLWGDVYGGSWFVDPASELSVVVLTNTAVSGMLGPFPNAVRDAVLCIDQIIAVNTRQDLTSFARTIYTISKRDAAILATSKTPPSV